LLCLATCAAAIAVTQPPDPARGAIIAHNTWRGSGMTQSNWRAARSTVSDTDIVRTLSGSVWRDTMRLLREMAIGNATGTPAFLFGRIGAIDLDSSGNIYVLDVAARDVRVFSPAGAHVRTFGRAGAGPGEFQSPNELRVTRDGRVVVREQGVRMSLFDEKGTFVRSWPLGSTFSSGTPLHVTLDNRILNRTLRDRLVWYALDGTPLDTVPVPLMGPVPPALQFAVPGGRSTYSIPFTAPTVWTLTVDGKLVAGYAGKYTFDVQGSDGRTLRVARDAPPVRVSPAEARSIRENLTRYIRQSAGSDWRWDGPDIPAVKPAYQSLDAGTDGTIWAVRFTPSREEHNPDYDPSRPELGPPTRWASPVVADVFDAGGRYLGAVKIPDGVWFSPRLILSAGRVWAAVQHEDGYPQVVRYSVVPMR
jgi:hypothetical protein